jgi:Holliday junction resolvase
MTINSRNKGCRGEREFVNFLFCRGYEARRGQQYEGSSDSPDVVCKELSGYHFEVKRVQAGNPYDWLDQAIGDAAGNVPVVVHRRNRRDWICVLRATDLLELIRKANDQTNSR